MKVTSCSAWQASSLRAMPLNPIRAIIRAFHRIAPQDWQGLGILTLTGLSVLLVPGISLAGNGVHINANNDAAGSNAECLSLNDSQLSFSSGSASAISSMYLRETLIYKDGASGKCSPDNKAGQTNSVMFYRPTDVAGVGATSLSLGGELYVNTGRLMLGLPDGSLLIGHVGVRGLVLASGGGIAIGRSVEATASGSVALGQNARATNTQALAFGNNASAPAVRGLAFGSASAATGEAATIFGASSLASGLSSFAGGRFAQPLGTGSVSVGYSTIAAAADSLALGFDADVRSGTGVALGDLSRAGDLRSVAPATLNGTSYSFDSSKVVGPVSIGGVATRTLVNLAPGSVDPSSTDTINGAQLFAGYTATQRLGDRELIASQSMADALGSGPLIDGSRVVLPPLSLVSLGAGMAQPTTLLGALKALDRSHADTDQRLGRVFDSAFATAQAFEELNFSGRLRWNAQTQTYDASHGETAQTKIIDLAAGEASLDVINKGQLDVIEGRAQNASQAADAAATLALQARDTAVQVEAAALLAQVTVTQAERDTDLARQAAETAQFTADSANESAAKAQATANSAQGDADAAADAIALAGQTAERAQREGNQASQQATEAEQTASDALARSTLATTAADEAQSQSRSATQLTEAAHGTANQVHEEAELAQRNAAAAQQAAAGAKAAVDEAQRSADHALQSGREVEGEVQAAQARADAAQTGAVTAQAAADRAQTTGSNAAAAATDAEATASAAQRTAESALDEASLAQKAVEGAQASLDTAQASVSTAGNTAERAQAASDRAAATSGIAQQRAQTAQRSAASAQVDATDVLNAVKVTQAHADEALEVANAVRQVAERAQDDAAAATASSGAVLQAVNTAEARAGQAQISADEARRAAGAAQATANQAGTLAIEARQAVDSAQGTADQAVATASNAQRDADQAAQTAERAADIGAGVQRVTETAERSAQAAAELSATAHQAANTALTTGQTAQDLATQAQHTADVGLASATASLDAAQRAREAAEQAQGAAVEAVTASGNARKSVDAAQGTADSAQQNANLAREHARAAQDTADRALGAADVAKRTAESAQGSADRVKASADLSASQLQGVGADETVIGRIDNAIRNAAGNASDFLTRVLGGGAGLDVDGKPFAPSYRIAELAGDAGATHSSHDNVGDALSHLDGNLNTLNSDVRAQDKGLDEVTAMTLGQRNDSVLWHETQGRYTAGRGEQRETPARIGNLADGLAPTDAVNKRQLEVIRGVVDSATALADEARDGGVRAAETGRNAQAIAAQVHLAADSARQSADAAGMSASTTQQIADDLRRDAEQTGLLAQRALGQLQGLAEGESVVDRVQETSRMGTQALANALGADAKIGVVGLALEALDGGVAGTYEAARQASTDVLNLQEQSVAGRIGLIRQDTTSGDIQVGRESDGTRVELTGNQGPRTLSGIQEGTLSDESNDAVNGRQLNTVKQQVAVLDQQRLGVAVDNRGDVNDSAHVVPGSRAVAVGASAEASGQHSVVTGAGAQAQADRATVSGADAAASARNSVAIGAGSHANRADSVAVGSAGRERQITQMAAATQRTDAINLRQATALSSRTAEQSLRQSNTYTNRRVGQLSQDVYAGVASAMAMAGLPVASSSGKSMLAMATAVYENQPAVAIGLTARSSSGRWTYGATGTGTARGDYAVTMGVGYHW